MSYIHFCNAYCTTALKLLLFSLTDQCALQTSVPSLTLLRFQAKALQRLALIQGVTCSLLTQSCVRACTLRPGPELCNNRMSFDDSCGVAGFFFSQSAFVTIERPTAVS